MSSSQPTPRPRALLRLPFTIAPVSSPAQLRDVLALRQQAYGRHESYREGMLQLLLTPDAIDLSGQSTTLVAVSKADQSVLGTVRLTSSLDAHIEWPEGTPQDECREGNYTFIERLAVRGDTDTALVASALIKAVYLWAMSRESEWGCALAPPALVRIYRRRGGMEVRGGGEGIDLSQYHGSRILLVAARTEEVRRRLATENPSYSAEFFDKVHPDIAVHGMSLPWSELRTEQAAPEQVSAHAAQERPARELAPAD